MRKKDRIILLVIAVALVASVLETYYQTIVKKNFIAVHIEETADEPSE